MSVEQRLKADAALVNAELRRTLRRTQNTDATLNAAMRYAVLGGGKRLRPFLLIESAALLGLPRAKAAAAAAALECLHSYSLVHDDLPSMDDDSMRRGQRTVHKKFDEATAILAGDALLTLAFEILADSTTHPDAEVRAELSLMLARAAGARGMVAGQMLDLGTTKLSKQQLLEMHALKTGALFRFSCEAGAVLAGARLRERRLLSACGAHLGALYQLADDLADMRKDVAKGRQNAVLILGESAVRILIEEHSKQATSNLEPLGKRALIFKEFAELLMARSARVKAR